MVNQYTMPIPAPVPRVAYEPPSFQTFQDRKRARQAQLNASTSYTPPPQPPPRSESARALPQPPAPGPAPLQTNSHSQSSPAIIERSDTLASVRSLDRQSSRRPLPKPPVAVNASKSLDRGLPGRRKPSTVEEEPTSPAVSDRSSVTLIPAIVVPEAPAIHVDGISINVPTTTIPSINVPSINMPVINEPSPDSMPTSHEPSSHVTMSAPPTIAVTTAQRIETDHAILCGGCEQIIIGRVVNAMQRRFHPHCFACSECGELLEHVSSYEWQGKAFCHLDYHDKFAHHCFHCKTPIVDPRFVTLNDTDLGERYYHELHFFCSECGDPFLDPSRAHDAEETNAFTIHRGHPYCERCHLRLHKPRCRGCKQPIPDVAVNALGHKWHKACFKCDMCSRPLADVFFPSDGQALCTGCYETT